jgi:single-stranded-DNA-specific exonuclease
LSEGSHSLRSMSFALRSVDAGLVARLAAALRVRPVTARCLAVRGVGEPLDARAFLEPKLGGLRRPEGLAGFARAVERIGEAVRRRERIGVWGDYDVDGVTTAALLTTFLRAVGGDVDVRVARRDGGYGFTVDAATSFADAGCTLIITGDCGTSDGHAIAGVAARGVDVVVVDHHTVPASDHHPAYALVNPYRPDSTFPFRGLASVGLAFYVVAAVRSRLRELGHFHAVAEPDVRDLLDLVALGTIADLVPLRGENRILTSVGLRQLEARRRPGIAALLAAAGVEAGAPVDERTVAWRLAPRINAPGRLGAAEPSLALLLADEATAGMRAAALEESNSARRAAQDTMAEEAMALIEREQGEAVVIASRGWLPGIVGIVAAKVMERTGRPTFAIAVDGEGVGRGSARSAGGVDLYRALGTCAGYLERFGGHAAAAGFTVREERLDALREGLCAAVAAQRAAVPTVEGEQGCDAEVTLDEVDDGLAAELGTLAPFGQDNQAPRLVARNVTVRTTRRVGDGSHLKLELEDERGTFRRAIAFGLGERDPGAGARIDVAFAPQVSTWQGQRRVELEVRDLALRP